MRDEVSRLPPQFEPAEEPRFSAAAFGTTTLNIMNGYSGFSGIPVNLQRNGRTAVCAPGESSFEPAGEENVHRAADYVNKITVDEIVALIREAGFRPVQRTTLYERVKAF